MSGITLSDGTYLPAGTNIEVPAHTIQMDPSVYPNPDKFDGFRFYNMRQSSAEEANRNQFVSVSMDSLNFGYGKHACPGRFFASNELKVILANVLLRYDIALEDQEAGRYKNWMYETMVSVLGYSYRAVANGCLAAHPRFNEEAVVQEDCHLTRI